MRTIYHEFFCDDEIGEADAFYEVIDGKLKMITSWSANDANFRYEYMGSLFKHLGVEIKDLPKKHKKEATAMMKEMWGIV